MAKLAASRRHEMDLTNHRATAHQAGTIDKPFQKQKTPPERGF